MLSRRQFVAKGAAVAAASIVAPRVLARPRQKVEAVGNLETFVPYRQLTFGPRHHWFGYYDKREFDSTNTLVLSNQVDFEGRSPSGDDTIQVGYVDTANGDAWHEIGASSAWGWQQGCMLQWIGDTGRRVIWNDRNADELIARIMDLETGESKSLPMPIYTLSPNGKYALSADFRRINNLRPGYGYAGLADPHVESRAPEDSGIWRIDLATGESKLIVSLAQVTELAWPDGDHHLDAWHYFNHLLVNPTSDRFVFLHRYRPAFDPATLAFKGGFVTRMFSCNLDGSDLYVLDPSGYTSHFIWDDSQHLTMWTRPAGRRDGFYQMKDQTEQVIAVGHEQMPENGHNTNLPSPYDDWILNDTYPAKQDRRQTVFLYHKPSGRRVNLGHFPSPARYSGEWRCDTHPRSSNDGKVVVVDSPTAEGRQLHHLDISGIIG